jgi:hypothetical protein
MTMKTRTERSGNWTLGPFAYVPVRHAKSGLTAAPMSRVKGKRAAKRWSRRQEGARQRPMQGRRMALASGSSDAGRRGP